VAYTLSSAAAKQAVEAKKRMRGKDALRASQQAILSPAVTGRLQLPAQANS